MGEAVTADSSTTVVRSPTPTGGGRRLYLVSPRPEAPHYFDAGVLTGQGFPAVQMLAELALPTIAAMVPSDFSVEILDEVLSPVDFSTPAEFVGITGKISQRKRMIELGEEFRRRGKTVLMGGPAVSLTPEKLRDSCDILVRGEIEDIAEDLFEDLRNRRWKSEYVGGRPDLSASPRPRWDLYPNDRAMMGTLQTSRGCPFECEFCDVIAYLGRKQRHKPVVSVLEELESLYAHGYRYVFLCDDNLTVYRRRAKELLKALADWNADPDREPVGFATQLSIEAAQDEELLALCAQAGLFTVFIGIETPNEDSLREISKRQNLLADPIEQVARFFAHGMEVRSGMVVGFDSDGPDIFERQFNFAMSSAIPFFSLGALVAPEATPLYTRMEREGRLVELPEEGETVIAVPHRTNIAPVGMTAEQLSVGMKWLANRLYRPKFFAERVCRFLEALQVPSSSPTRRVIRNDRRAHIWRNVRTMVNALAQSAPEEQQMFARIHEAIRRKPEVSGFVSGVLLQYLQIRFMYRDSGYWDPDFGALDAPPI